MHSSLPSPWRCSTWLISLLLAGISSAMPARAVDDGHGGAAQGVRVETLAKSDQAWNGERHPPIPAHNPWSACCGSRFPPESPWPSITTL